MNSRRSNKAIEEKLDRLWSKKVKERDPMCQRCGFRKSVWAHHVHHRKNRNLRWDLQNGLGLCNICHTAWHSYPEINNANFGFANHARAEYLRNKSQRLATTIDYDAILKELEGK